ncbi:hypothetical protein FHR70_000705 [Microvirga lupini]|uniref:Uncharacterized protein n=1 Tax=Microvirga lupini TaxID=420324 RepID=A0A7W4VI59_9HYPH|nr:hypothetical protein [Microvirga lupini]MBB3017665.1 hypothetical protein [Microvirga lupini]
MSKQNELELNSTSTLALTGNALGHEFGHQDYGTLQLNGVRLVNEAWLLGMIEQRDQLLAALENAEECLAGVDATDYPVSEELAQVRAAIAAVKGGAQ